MEGVLVRVRARDGRRVRLRRMEEGEERNYIGDITETKNWKRMKWKLRVG